MNTAQALPAREPLRMSGRKSDAIKAIKERVSLAELARRYVEVRSVGSRLVAPCPFHQETKPSFSINEEMGTFYCFGCQASGDIFDFYGRLNGLDFKETLDQLAEEAGVRLADYNRDYQPDPHAGRERSQKRDMLKMHDVAAGHFHSCLAGNKGDACREYVAERGLSREIIDKFRLGWSPAEWQSLRDSFQRSGFKDATAVECGLLSRNASGRVFDRFRGRLMFPIYNLTGQVVAFGGRILPALAGEDDAKYINSSDSPIYKKGEHLYGLFQARKAITVKKNVMLTEGYMDVVTLHQFGYTEAVGVLGTALTPEQVKRLSGFSSSLELLFDGDNAGRKAALRACEMFLSRGLSCRVVLFPEKEDIDSLLRTAGVEAFEELRKSAMSGMSFCVEALRALSPREAVEWARNFLGQVDLPELFTLYASELAGSLGLSEAELRGGVADRMSRGRHGQPAFSSKAVPKAVSRDREIMTFAVRYPHRLDSLRECGADLCLQSPWARRLWEKLELSSAEEVFRTLEDREKQFWVRCRDTEAGAPALNNENGELSAIIGMLSSLQASSHKDSVAAALRRQSGDYDVQREFLRALTKARGRQGDQ